MSAPGRAEPNPIYAAEREESRCARYGLRELGATCYRHRHVGGVCIYCGDDVRGEV